LNRIVITGAPGTGKTSIINFLKSKGYTCFEEFSRTLIKSKCEYRVGDSFFKKQKIFNTKIIEKRIIQYNDSKKITNSKDNLIFFDRCIYDTYAYQKLEDNSFSFPQGKYIYKYQKVFILSPWEEIYVNDNERLESFNKSKDIDKYIRLTYNHYNLMPNNVSKASLKNRVDYILSKCL